MHTESLPPTDRDDQAPNLTVVAAVPTAREELKRRRDDDSLPEDQRLSNAQIATGMNVATSAVSSWLNGKYNGDGTKMERLAAAYLREVERSEAMDAPTLVNDVVAECNEILQVIHRRRLVGGIVGPPGNGKTRALEHFAKDHDCLLITASNFRKTEGAMIHAIFSGLDNSAWDNRTPRGDWIIRQLKYQSIFIVVDDAHKLTEPALQLFFDLHDATRRPVALVGTQKLQDNLRRDGQRLSRNGYFKPVGIDRSNRPQIRKTLHGLIDNIARDSGEELMDLCEQVALKHGGYRSVRNQLTLTVDIKSSPAGSRRSWADCFRAAHTRLVRDYVLT